MDLWLHQCSNNTTHRTIFIGKVCYHKSSEIIFFSLLVVIHVSDVSAFEICGMNIWWNFFSILVNLISLIVMNANVGIMYHQHVEVWSLWWDYASSFFFSQMNIMMDSGHWMKLFLMTRRAGPLLLLMSPVKTTFGLEVTLDMELFFMLAMPCFTIMISSWLLFLWCLIENIEITIFFAHSIKYIISIQHLINSPIQISHLIFSSKKKKQLTTITGTHDSHHILLFSNI